MPKLLKFAKPHYKAVKIVFDFLWGPSPAGLEQKKEPLLKLTHHCVAIFCELYV